MTIRHRPKALADNDQWLRWQSVTPGGWKTVERAQSLYRCEGQSGDQWVELGYRNLVPDPEQWDAVLSGRTLPRAPRASLITDFYSYNTNMSKQYSDLLEEPGMARYAWMQPHWVGDLTLGAKLEVTSSAGEVRLELIKGGVPHRCTIDLATGIGSICSRCRNAPRTRHAHQGSGPLPDRIRQRGRSADLAGGRLARRRARRRI